MKIILLGKKSRASIEWLKIVEFLILFMLFPMFLFSLLVEELEFVLNFSYYFIVDIIVFQATWSYLQSYIAVRRRFFKVKKVYAEAPLPRTTFIVSAYLPNEAEIIKATLLNLLENVDRPVNGIEVIVAYNTPKLLAVEEMLKSMALKYSELILANNYHSKSKSENINYALEIASGEMIGLIDADHIVSQDCLKRAWRWINSGYDAVQGRCVVRNIFDSKVTQLVDVEFEAMYNVSHTAKSLMFDSALFGGSNGFWRADVIKKMKFDTERLTEDIDCTMRALLSGHHIVHDRSIISLELAPKTWTGLWYQRKRWSQGWFQVAVKYFFPIIFSRYLRPSQKIMWVIILHWRIFYDVVTQFLPAVLISYWLYKGRVELPINAYVIASLIYSSMCGPIEAWAAYKNAVDKRHPAVYWYYILMTVPYTIYKNLISVIAIRDELVGEKKWIVSKRG